MHIEDVAREPGHVLGEDRFSDDLIWRRHRATKRVIAEEIEHRRLDAALTRDGQEAEAIRDWWTPRAEEADPETLAAVRAIRAQEQHQEPVVAEAIARKEQVAAWAYEQPRTLNVHTPADLVVLLVHHYGWRDAYRVAADLIEDWAASGVLIIADPEQVARTLREIADGGRATWHNND